MSGKVMVLVLLAGCSFSFCGVVQAASGASQKGSDTRRLPPAQTARTNSGAAPKVVVRTNFVDGASLTVKELGDVISLGIQCGITNPAEVRTFYWLPGGGKGIEVKSVERVSDRNVYVDEMTLGRDGWTYIGPNEGVKRVGEFWGSPSDKFTRHLRVYEFRGERIRVDIGGFSPEVANKVIGLIAANKVRFESKDEVLQFNRREMEEMAKSKPTRLSRQEDGKLWLHVEGTWSVLQFRFEKGEVIAEQVVHIAV